MKTLFQTLAAVMLCVPTALALQGDPHAGNPHADPHGGDPHAHSAQYVRFEPIAAPVTAPIGADHFDAETVRLFGTLPVQDGGRIKPLSTLAGFKLLRFNGKRKLTLPNGDRIDATEWLMHCLFFPEQAREYECFLVQNDEVLTAIGLHVEGKKKRDRYSFEQLRPGFGQLMEKRRELAHLEPKQMDTVERQLVALANNLSEFNETMAELDFANLAFVAGDAQRAREALGADTVRLDGALAAYPELHELFMELGREGDPANPDYQAAGQVLQFLEANVGLSRLALLAPEVPVEQDTEWRTALDLTSTVAAGNEPTAESIAVVGLLTQLVERRGDPAAFQETLEELHTKSAALADARDQYASVRTEGRFYQADFFYRALVFFVLSFVLVAISWLRPSSVWLQRGIWASLLVGTVLATAGITARCIIRGRPPVTTLYETILFISVVCVLVAILIEVINRQRIALALATVFGAFGMWLSMKYELKEAATVGDTMPSLVAVLDTNFWLSTHVTTVTMGYSAGLLASLLAQVWVVGKLFGLKRGDTGFYKHVARMVYGVLCFGLLFSVVGTILGGIWANYSWGRFWGWDPKENGALLICLWELMILHARMGGYIKDRGLCNLAILGGCVVAFSWWGVNLLGVGLHSYGFTDGVGMWLLLFYTGESLLVGVSVIHHFTEKRIQQALAEARLGAEGSAQ